jgi:HK97 family phage major capsid protein
MKSYVERNWIRLLSVAVVVALAVAGVLPEPGLLGAAMAAPFLIGDTEPSLKDVLKALETQGQAWEVFKRTNDERLAAIKKDSVDKPLLEASIATINSRMGELGETIAKFQAAQARLALAGTQTGNQRVKSEGEQTHEKAFNTYLRRGDKKSLEAVQDYALGEKTASVGSDADGGFFVTPDLSGRLIQKIFETSPLRQDASLITISTDALEGVLDNDDSVTCGWVGEQAARPATATPKTAKWRIPVFEMYAMPETTQQLLDDAAVDVEAWLQGKVQDKMVRTENTAFFTGDGVTKPRGILTYTTAATADSARAWGTLEHVATGTSGGFGAVANGTDKLVSLVHSMKAAYRGGAKFYMNRATLGQVRTLKDGNSQYLWLPSMSSAQPSSLLGFPVREMEDMPAIGANSLSIAFANMALAYQIVDRQGFRVLRDPFTNKPYVRFYTTRRVGGDVLHFEALKFLKFA